MCEIADMDRLCFLKANLSWLLKKAMKLWRSQQVFSQREIVINRGPYCLGYTLRVNLNTVAD